MITARCPNCGQHAAHDLGCVLMPMRDRRELTALDRELAAALAALDAPLTPGEAFAVGANGGAT